MVMPKKSEDDDVGMSLVDTIMSPNLSDLAQDFSEVALDSILKDGILKDIPVINSIVGIAKVAISIRDKLLIKKILCFLHELGDTTEEERKKFLQEFENDPKAQRKVGENLILVLDRLDDLDKPAMVAKILKAYIKGEIALYEEFVYFSSIIDRAPMLDLSAFLSFFSGKVLNEEWLAQKFYSLGLSSMTIKINPKYRPEPDDPFDAIKHRMGRGTNETDNAIVKYRLSIHASFFAKILLGNEYNGVNFYPNLQD